MKNCQLLGVSHHQKVCRELASGSPGSSELGAVSWKRLWRGEHGRMHRTGECRPFVGLWWLAVCPDWVLSFIRLSRKNLRRLTKSHLFLNTRFVQCGLRGLAIGNRNWRQTRKSHSKSWYLQDLSSFLWHLKPLQVRVR